MVFVLARFPVWMCVSAAETDIVFVVKLPWVNKGLKENLLCLRPDTIMFLCLWGRWSDIWSVLWDHNFLNVLLYSQYFADFVSEPINSKANWFHLISGDYEYYPETCWMRSVKLASCDKTDLTPKYHHWCQTTMHWWAGGSNLDD